MPITRLNPLSDDEGPLVTFTSTCEEKKSQGGETDKQACCECVSPFNCLNACVHTRTSTHLHATSLLPFKVMNKVIKLTLSM